MGLDFRNFYYLFFFYLISRLFENLELTCHLTSFRDKFIVAPSGWKPPNAASVCWESMQILQNRETCSRSMQAPLTSKVKPLIIFTYMFDTNICWNKIAIYSVRFDVNSTWFDSLLCYFALFHSTAYPPPPPLTFIDSYSQTKPEDMTPIPDTNILFSCQQLTAN